MMGGGAEPAEEAEPGDILRGEQRHLVFETPGPIAKHAMKAKIARAVIQPLVSLGMGVMSAFSILSGAVRAAARSAKGFLKNASTDVDGMQLSRVSSTGLAVGSSERATLVAARKSP